MKIDQSGIDFIKSFEKFSPAAYKDSGGKYTIGYGHTENVSEDSHTITEYEAEQLLQVDLIRPEHFLDIHVKIKLEQWEYNALCSLIFNIGVGNFLVSTLLKRLNAGDKAGAAKEFQRFVYCRDPKTNTRSVSPGLSKRRELEKELFLSQFNLSRNQSAE